MEIDSNLAVEFKLLGRENVEFVKKCAEVAQDIKCGQSTIVTLVEQLGALLVDLTPGNRELGMWILTQVLEGLVPNHLDAKQLSFICGFYADRLKDHHQVIPATLAGILTLSKFEQFPEGAATQLLSALFHNVACQQQQEQDRHTIYKIFDSLLSKCGTELCTMGLDFVYGVISAVDGERNPKNLIFLFCWMPKFVKTVNLAHLTEEAFEVLACYFPVDFKAPAQDSNVITRDQLADYLAPCLTAIPQFAEFCFPLALEKIESSLEVAKLDALKLLEIGCLSFDSASYVQHSTEIWSQIQKELFNNPSPNVEVACLRTLIAVVKKISEDSSVAATVKDISDTVKGNLLPDSKLFEPSSKLLFSIAKASKVSANIVNREIVPILINTFNITKTPAHKIVVLKALVNFFDSYVQLHDRLEMDEIKKIPILCLKASIDDSHSLQKVGFNGLSHISQFIPSDVRFSVYDNLQKLLPVAQIGDVRNSILKCFDTLAQNFPTEVDERVINKTENIDSSQALELYLDALCVIASQDYFTNKIISILIGYLNKEPSLGRVAVASLKKMLDKNETDRMHSVLGQKNITSSVIDWSLHYLDRLEEECLQHVAWVLKAVIGNHSSDKQKDMVCSELPKLNNLSTRRVFLLDGLLCRLKRDVRIDYSVLDELTDVVLRENNETVKIVAVQLLANLLNKCDENILNSYLGRFSDDKTDLSLMSWITKALVMRNHELANSWIDKLIQRLEDDKNVAVCFRVVINDNFDTLSTKSFCIRSFLYQQKFFTVVSNKLSDNYRPGCNSYLVALGYLLEYAPKQAVLLQFKKLLKLIILCLDECDDSEVVTVILHIIKDFISEKETCIEDNLSDFLTRFLRLSKFDKSLKVRIQALQCLQKCTSSFSVYKLLVHQQEVLTGLGTVIDDKKRIVRREAVEARTLWFLIDAPM